MFLQRLRQRWLNRPATASRTKPAPQHRARLVVEPLEDRAVPASFTAATVPELIGAITAANQSPEADTITLVPGKTFTLTASNNYESNAGATGLPVIAATGALTISGNGDVLERSTAAGTPEFRLFRVAAGAALTLQNLTLQGGVSYGLDESGGGGAISNAGSLTLRGVTVQNNVAQAHTAMGGGIASTGALTVENCIIRNNQARGGAGGWSSSWEFGAFGWDGGNAYGGGVYVGAGTATLLGTTITGNVAQGGKSGGHGTKAGRSFGGGLCIQSPAVVYLDAFTVEHVKSNKASTSDSNIHGTYTVLP